jgi:hypothetical protein
MANKCHFAEAAKQTNICESELLHLSRDFVDITMDISYQAC